MKKTIKGFIAGAALSLAVSIPILTYGEAALKIDVILDRIKLVVNDKPVNSQTILYNGTTYVPIRTVSENLGAKVDFDTVTKTASISMPVSESADIKTAREEAVPEIHVNPWSDGRFILEPTAESSPDDPTSLEIKNSTDISFDFKLLKADGSTAAEGTASVKDSEATFNATELDILKFNILNGDITVTEAKGLVVVSGKGVYKKENTEDKEAVSTFKEGNYSSGSSASARSLVISNLTAVSFDYQIIASDGKRIITKGNAKILSDGSAECTFEEGYKITFKPEINNVITAEESEQRLLENGRIVFYTV